MKRSFLVALSLNALLSCLGCAPSRGSSGGASLTQHPAADLSPVRTIAAYLKEQVKRETPETLAQRITNFYAEMELYDLKSGEWIGQELTKTSAFLIPNDLDQTKLAAFIDRVAEVNEQNPYLVKFLESARHTSFPKFDQKLREEGSTLLPEVVAYAIMLERMTISMRNNWRLMEECYDYLPGIRKKRETGRYMEWFDFAKMKSVEVPIRKAIQLHKEGEEPGDFLRLFLPLNISEAVIADLQKGYLDNARAGVTLAANNPESNCSFLAKGPCRASWSSDHKAIEIDLPAPKEWDDLYQVWNLAFTSGLGSFPLVFAKLLIPQVAGYQDSPREYIYNRMIALYVHLNYRYLRRVTLASEKRPYDFGWSDETLTKLFGKVNLESAANYSAHPTREGRAWLQRGVNRIISAMESVTSSFRSE